MPQQRFPFLALVVAVVLLSYTRCESSAHAAEPPNVLFIAVDDLRPEMTCYGVAGMVTPNLDRLAQRGVRFDRAYCNIAVCGASRASIMTGLRPTPTRFTSYLTRADQDAPGVPSVPLVFKQHGYHTASNGKVYHHLTDDAEAWSDPPWRPEKSSIWWALAENRQLSGQGSRGPAYESADQPDDVYPDHQICDKTLADLRRLANKDKPFFVACGFYRPHLPFVAPQRYWELYPTEQIALPDNMYFPRDLPRAFLYTWGEMRAYNGIPKQGPVSDETARQLIRGYRACVSFIDVQIGRLLDELDRLGEADNTIIVLWGDHGWQLGEHGFWCKHTNFEVATRVPLLIVAPGVEGGRVSRRLVEYIDVYPTLCDLAGFSKPDHLQGRSLRPLLQDVDAEHKEAVFTRFGGGDAVRTDGFRYMEMRSAGGRGELQGVGLFELTKDPRENQNVAEDSAFAGSRGHLETMLHTVALNQEVQAVIDEVDKTCRETTVYMIGPEKAKRLAELVRQKKPKLVVECGTAIGYSGLWIARELKAAGSGRLITIEIDEDRAARARANFAKAGLADVVEVRVADARQMTGKIEGPVDFLFIDCNYSNYYPCLRGVEERLAPGAVVVADNVGMGASGMKDYLDHVRSAYDSRTEWFDIDLPWGQRDAMEVTVIKKKGVDE